MIAKLIAGRDCLGVDDDVLVVSHSDFARTLTPNGNDPGLSLIHI